mgnify:CR=1 FL=1
MRIFLGVLSSAGRASPLQGEGRGFDPLSTHQETFLVNNRYWLDAINPAFIALAVRKPSPLQPTRLRLVFT